MSHPFHRPAAVHLRAVFHAAAAVVACAATAAAPAEDAHASERAAAPILVGGEVRGAASAFAGADHLQYFVDTGFAVDLALPSSPLRIGYEHHETLAFLELDRSPPSGATQLDRIGRLDMVRASARATDGLDLGLAFGWANTDLADRPGGFDAKWIGPSLALSLPDVGLRADLLAGGIVDEDSLADRDAWYRLLLEQRLPGNLDPVAVDLRYEALGDPWPTGGYLEVGPSIRIADTGPADLRLTARYVRIDDQPLTTVDDEGWTIGFEARKFAGASPHVPDDANRLDATGQVEFAAGDEGASAGYLAEIAWRPGASWWGIELDYDAQTDLGDEAVGIYDVCVGPIGVVALPALPANGPSEATIGIGVSHRSDHGLDVSVDRINADGSPSDLGPLIPHANINVFPRIWFSTRGWTLRGRRAFDPARWDVFFSAGRRLDGAECDDGFAGQAGARVDIARADSWRWYARGSVGTGGESPSVLAETGVESGAWVVFARWEDHDVEERLGDETRASVGVGIRM